MVKAMLSGRVLPRWMQYCVGASYHGKWNIELARLTMV